MKIGIIGSGESGTGAALLAKQKNYEVFISESGVIHERYKEIIRSNGIAYEEGGHSLDRLKESDLVIKSPGVPDHSDVITQLKSADKKIISEIEFGFMHCTSKILAVTGSNGKTTTSGLFFHLMKTAGYDCAIGGNYGESFAGLMSHSNPEYIVLEVSSFQLDGIVDFKPLVAILLNITPDHMDRYDYEIEKYAASKFRITENQTAEDLFIYNGDDEITKQYIDSFPTHAGVNVIKSSMYEKGIASKDGTYFELSIKGRHNLFNAMCVVEACRFLGLNEIQIALGLKSFKNLPHRLETVGMINGVEFINDSKATNVDSVYYALEAMTKPVIWVAGGTDKGNDYSPLFEQVSKKVKALICLGVDNSKLKTVFKEKIHIVKESTKVSSVVAMAMEIAESGDVVLLSPACASFDLFKNYVDRGDQFKKVVLDYQR